MESAISPTETPPSDPRRRLCYVDGLPVTYTDEGEGPPLVLVHGVPGSVRDFRHLAAHLRGLRVLRIDLPGFGGTARGDRVAWTPADRADLVAAWMDALGAPRAVVAGHSMGGAVAVALAERHPARVAGLGLIASPGVTPHASYARAHVPSAAAALRIPGAAAALRGPLHAAFVRAGFPRSTPRHQVVSALLDAGALDFPAHAARVRRLTVPTLVAWADDDPLVEASVSVELAEEAPDGPRLRWATGGHNVQKTHAAELGAALVAFAEA